MEFRIEQVPADATWELRRRVLRPGQAVDQLALADDDDPSTGTYAAIGENEEIIGTVRVGRERPPFPPDPGAPHDATAWRLRAMATREDLRSSGVGRATLGRALQHVAEHGGGLLWCNARVPARNLYRRAGFVEHGEPWNDPDIGPHVVMWRWVEPVRSDVRGHQGRADTLPEWPGLRRCSSGQVDGMPSIG